MFIAYSSPTLREPEVFAPHGATKLGRAGARRRLGSLAIEAHGIVSHAQPSDDVDARVVLGDVEAEPGRVAILGRWSE